jgi:uncharacterized membrane protein
MQKYLNDIQSMGLNELELFKEKVVKSELDRDEKKALFDAISEREKVVCRDDAMAVSCDDCSID